MASNIIRSPIAFAVLSTAFILSPPGARSLAYAQEQSVLITAPASFTDTSPATGAESKEVVGVTDVAESATSDQWTARRRNLLDLIGALEAPGGYDVVFSKVSAPPPKKLTSMTVAEVLAWQDRIDATSISEAAGRYQILEDTLRRLVRDYGIDRSRLYDPTLQDKLAALLLEEAGWTAFRKGELTSIAFGDALAKIWAALPRLSGPKRGRSHYHGIVGNRARASAPAVEAALGDLGNADLIKAAIASAGAPTAKTARAVLKPSPAKARLAQSRVRVWAKDPFYTD